jgi:hypothetical protein
MAARARDGFAPPVARRVRERVASRNARPVDRLGDARGQATADYVALVALVATALTLAAGLTSGGLGGHVLAGVQQGLCRVALASCPRPLTPRPDLAPCQLTRASRVERLSETIAFMRLGTGGTLSAARASDGRVSVTLADGDSADAELGVGARLRLGARSLGGAARAGIGVSWASGRTWTFPDAAAASRFVAAYGAKATIGGQLVDRLRSRCSLLCDALGWRPHPRLPPPDETFEEGGATARLTASLGMASSGGELSGVLGRRIARDGATTWYLRLDATATSALGLPALGPAATAGGEALLSLSLDAGGRPRALGVQLVREAGMDAAASGRRARLRGSVGAGAGAVVELDATLDLRDAGNRAAAARLLDALRDPRRVGTAPRRLGALAARIARHGQLDRRVYAVRRTGSGVEATLRLGVSLGAAFERTTSGLTLVRAETRLPGLPFLPRDDCRPA